jgi:hypothetical protein
LSLQKWTLRDTRVVLLGLGDGDGVIFEIEEDLKLSDTVIFKIAFRDAFLEETVESEDLGGELKVRKLPVCRA